MPSSGPSPSASPPPPPSPPDSSRRLFLRRAGIGASLALGGGTSLYGFAIGSHDYVVEEVPIRLARLPRALEGYTIAQLSDVHLGLFVGGPEMRAAVELVRRAKPDLVVMTGDLLDNDLAHAPKLVVDRSGPPA